VIKSKGYRVITALDGRSEVTRRRAERSQIEDVGFLENVVKEADFLLSIMPPEDALKFAGKVAEFMKDFGASPVFVDCNAVSPDTTLKIEAIMAKVTRSFIKVGIIGPPPRKGVISKFYASGPNTEELEFLDGEGISFRPVGDVITRAAAIKMCYAGLTKGNMTLHAAVLTVANLLGVSKELQAELSESQKFHWDLMNKRVPFYAADAGRWAGEMDEISKTFSHVGVSGQLHQGAADIFRLLDASPLGVETRETVNKNRTLEQAVEIYADTVRKTKL
jgi:3-hydroxyisobutyrate dehydrogenase-like beta-hydroxyacid dehydrogenase